MWLPGPNIKRRGEPEFGMSFAGRDRGGLVCGGRLVLAGGRGGTAEIDGSAAESERRRPRTSKRRRSPGPKPKPHKAQVYNLVDVWLANTSGPILGGGSHAKGSPGIHPQQVYKLSAAVTLPKVVCLADRYVLIAGGHPASGCFDSAVHLLDLDAPPASGSALPLLPYTLNSTTSSFAAVSYNGTAMFFNGASAEVFSL